MIIIHKILLTCGLNSSTNLGTAAQILSFISCIKKFDQSISFSMFSYFPTVDRFYSKYGVQVIDHDIDGNHVLVSMAKKISQNMLTNGKFVDFPENLSSFNEADLIVDFNGDAISSDIENTILPMGLFVNTLPMSFGLLAKKPVVLFSQSIGPFDKLGYIFAKSFLSRVKLIVARDKISYSYLKDMRLSNSLVLYSEVAFLLEPICPSDNYFKKDVSPIIGFSVSSYQGTYFSNYRDLIAGLLKWIVKELNGHIIFIPHVTDFMRDDRDEARQICARIPEIKDRITLIEAQLSPGEAKWLIGKCDLFIASRWHASIAALSMGVPTITLGSSHKYWATMMELGLSRYAVKLDSSLESFIAKTRDAWIHREVIKNNLKPQVEGAKKSAENGVRFIAEMIKER